MSKNYYTVRNTIYGYRWIIYAYLPTTWNNETVLFSSEDRFDTKEDALDACEQFIQERDIDAELE